MISLIFILFLFDYLWALVCAQALEVACGLRVDLDSSFLTVLLSELGQVLVG